MLNVAYCFTCSYSPSFALLPQFFYVNLTLFLFICTAYLSILSWVVSCLVLFLLPALVLSKLTAASSLLHRKAAGKKAAAESHISFSQLATAPGSVYKIPGFDHCSISVCFLKSCQGAFCFFFTALLMYQLDMARVQGDVVKAWTSHHKKDNWLTTVQGLKTNLIMHIFKLL